MMESDSAGRDGLIYEARIKDLEAEVDSLHLQVERLKVEIKKWEEWDQSEERG